MQTALKTTGAGDLPDAELVLRICAGNHHAFELLMRRYNRVLFRTARSVLKDDSEAEDALQDAYLQAYRNMHAFRGDASLQTWLTRIVLNEAIARSRKLGRRAEIIDLGLGTDEPAQEEQAMDHNSPASPENMALRGQFRALLEKHIDKLPDAFRTVFVLRAVEELGADEVALCLGIPEATVRTRFFRARGMLRESLNRELDFAVEEAFSFDGARCDRIVGNTLARLKASQENV